MSTFQLSLNESYILDIAYTPDFLIWNEAALQFYMHINGCRQSNCVLKERVSKDYLPVEKEPDTLSVHHFNINVGTRKMHLKMNNKLASLLDLEMKAPLNSFMKNSSRAISQQRCHLHNQSSKGNDSNRNCDVALRRLFMEKNRVLVCNCEHTNYCDAFHSSQYYFDKLLNKPDGRQPSAFMQQL
ncbi:unnamed protein product [Dracunculus medinensis]|uniref:Phlebovirus glycoprotein G2 fusion domain-containing protein n=1 Tax=Dracunculus medinensis TaxID=318479 RepID=A0A158Q6J9_DRAME|nr:unnamed protein product [Dracunculus medinensis]